MPYCHNPARPFSADLSSATVGAPFADFNVIFCQNVLIYFEREKQRWIIDQLADRLRNGGLLILGAGEDVRWLNQSMRRVQWPGVCAYKKDWRLS